MYPKESAVSHMLVQAMMVIYTVHSKNKKGEYMKKLPAGLKTLRYLGL